MEHMRYLGYGHAWDKFITVYTSWPPSGQVRTHYLQVRKRAHNGHLHPLKRVVSVLKDIVQYVLIFTSHV